IDFKPESQKTKVSEGLRYLTNAVKKRCTAFIISDFMDSGFDNAINIAGRKHDLVALRVFDKRESELPNIGLTRVYNKESDKKMWVDTSSAKVRDNYKNWWQNHEDYLNKLFLKSGVDAAHISTDQDFVKPLVGLFKKREARF
ncbi:MAG: DUF58 domain-containing protein, partial [Bacteroidales bacterium]|nr:DUF58 domain-containing protein [Bacteroidales bacterium]